MNEAQVKNLIRIEKFLGVKKPQNTNWIQWSEELYELQNKWEDDNQELFPYCEIINSKR